MALTVTIWNTAVAAYTLHGNDLVVFGRGREQRRIRTPAGWAPSLLVPPGEDLSKHQACVFQMTPPLPPRSKKC
ncbi:hypothetical protein BKA70DRAFT_1444474 [Coprinopsis sp. MPI-PUGE-AT-0042]|nr:hypothetical protein BKA70DRAFT_1444474 [Coprinopsis sp. MPI-PUGE-AT-0042]